MKKVDLIPILVFFAIMIGLMIYISDDIRKTILEITKTTEYYKHY